MPWSILGLYWRLNFFSMFPPTNSRECTTQAYRRVELLLSTCSAPQPNIYLLHLAVVTSDQQSWPQTRVQTGGHRRLVNSLPSVHGTCIADEFLRRSVPSLSGQGRGRLATPNAWVHQEKARVTRLRPRPVSVSSESPVLLSTFILVVGGLS